MDKNKLLFIAGGVLVILIIVTLLFSNTPKKQTARQQAVTPQPTPEFGNKETFPTTVPELKTQIPGNWYTHQDLVFKLPVDWKVTTGSSTDTTAFAQPNTATSISTLPRLQIAVDDSTASDYIKPETRYVNYGVDDVIFSKYQNVDLAYKTPDPFDFPDSTGNVRKMQEMVVVLRGGDRDYRVIFQYENAQKNSDEKIFESIIGSLHYR